MGGIFAERSGDKKSIKYFFFEDKEIRSELIDLFYSTLKAELDTFSFCEREFLSFIVSKCI